MRVIIHNSLSLDGSLLGFDIDMAMHYKIAGSFKADIHLVGSNTAAEGLKAFFRKLPAEEEKDFVKPKASSKLPLWIIPDSSGKLKGRLHMLRRSGHSRDIVVLTSSATPKSYLQYLTDRNYDWHYMGNRPLDYSAVMELLAKEYKAKTILVDSGKTLSGILLNNGLADEISLLIHPIIIGSGHFPLLDEIRTRIELKLKKSKLLSNGCMWMAYAIRKRVRKT